VPTEAVPPQFAAALDTLRDPQVRPDIQLSEIPGPSRLAPFTIALEGDLIDADVAGSEDDGDDVVASGRFVVLHNPAGEDAWGGEFRIVVLINADLDAEVADDPLLDGVAWSWLTELLDEAGLATAELNGTVTRVLSTSFGATSLEQVDEPSAEIEIRASWTPVCEPGAAPDLGAHLRVWSDLMALAHGGAREADDPRGDFGIHAVEIDEVPAGVTPINSHRHHRGQR
jgi:hypothetical protein